MIVMPCNYWSGWQRTTLIPTFDAIRKREREREREREGSRSLKYFCMCLSYVLARFKFFHCAYLSLIVLPARFPDMASIQGLCAISIAWAAGVSWL